MIFDGTLILVVGTNQFNLQGVLQDALVWVQNLGPAGAIAFIAIYILTTVLFIPASLLTLGGGALFGVFLGSVYAFVAAAIGATLAFLIGRYLVRGWVTRRIEGNPKFKAIDNAIAKEGLKIIILTRLSPIFPFNLLNYALGTTQVSLRDYLLGFIGMLPGTIMYVYLGSLVGNIAALTSNRERTLAEWILYGVGLIAAITATVYITRIARQALNESFEG
jgi:uncharacterized membrane protein YdjX (TVP38/TMEM64 family)